MRNTSSISAAIAVAALACTGSPEEAVDATTITPSGPRLLVAGSEFHGIHGLTFDDQDRLYAGSVVGQATYRVDTETGEVEIYKAPPTGMADDLEFGPDGTLVWTSFLLGKTHAQREGEDLRVLAEGLPGSNSIAFNDEGRLFMTQVFAGDALWELDPEGVEPPRQILEGQGGLNGFDFGPDGRLYGPLWFKGEVVRVDVDSGELETVASGFTIPAAANFDSQGNLWVLDTALGHVVRVDVDSGAKTIVAEVATAIDNLAIDSQDRLYISNMADNGIYEIDTRTGDARTVIEGELSIPGGIALSEDGRTLWVADVFALRTVDTTTGEVVDVARMQGDELEYPDNIALSDDTIWLSSFIFSAIQRIDRDTGESLGFWHDVAAPLALLPTGDGGVLVAQASGEILRISADGAETTVIARDLGVPVAMVWAGEDSIYVSEAGAGSITSVEVSSGEKREIAAGLAQPEGLALAPNGHLIVAEVGLQSLLEIDPASGSRQVIADGLPIGLAAPQGVPPSFIPTGVAVAADGTVYFSSDLENAIYTISRP